MPIFKIELPKEVADWILKEKKTQPGTYIQNTFVDPIIKEYETTVGEIKRKAADEDTKTEIEGVKKRIKVTEDK